MVAILYYVVGMVALLGASAVVAKVLIDRVRRASREALSVAHAQEQETRDAHNQELESIQKQLVSESEHFASELADRDRQLREAHSHFLEEHRKTNSLKKQSANRLDRIKSLEDQLEKLDDWDGRLWNSPVPMDAPPFIPREDRKTRFIALLNLKGGVGKTTITANLGVSLARRGKRVLLVDLDFQYSMTGLCLGMDDRKQLLQTRATSARLLDPVAPADFAALVKNVRGLPKNAICHVIGADESLADEEHRAQARWLVGLVGMDGRTPEIDARFLFRTVFHSEALFKKYDFVLFDCPPRLTTACVNALSCSDYLLVPTLLDQLSVEAIPRTLAHLERLSGISSARLLGVVGNRAAFREGNLIARHQNSYEQLRLAVENSPYAGKRVFRATVRTHADIEAAANAGNVAALTEAGLEFFKDVTDAVDRACQDDVRFPGLQQLAIEVA